MKSLTQKINVMFALLVCSVSFATAQPNPLANYGFETTNLNGWTTSSGNGTISNSNSNARTGSRSFQSQNPGTNTASFVENTSAISVPANKYLIIFGYYRVSAQNSSSRAQIGIAGNMGPEFTPAATNTYYEITRSIQNTTGSTQNWNVRFTNYRTSANTSNRTFLWDDFIAYVSDNASPDLTDPNAPTNVRIAYTTSSATLNWTNNTDNSGGSGIARTVVLRAQSNNCAIVAPDLNDRRIYSAAGGYGLSSQSFNSVTWTVIDTVSAGSTTFTDNTIANNTDYVYAIVHEDFAYNHSTSALAFMRVRAASNLVPANNTTGVVFEPTNPTLSWTAPSCGANRYDVYFSSTQSLVDNLAPEARIATNLTTTSFVPSIQLNANTVYHWRVVSKNNDGLSGANEIATSRVVFTTFTPLLSYNVSRSTNINYQSIMSTGTNFSWSGTMNADDKMTDILTLTSIGFTGFRYQGAEITALRANTNGFITFNTGSGASFVNSPATETQIIAPFWEDLVCQGYINSLPQATQLNQLQSSMKYLVTGEAGDQVLTIEWSEMEIFNNPGPSINFQLKLYQRDNKIEFVYGRMFGFNGTVNYTYTYTSGLTGRTVADPLLTGQAYLLQQENVLNWSHTGVTNLSEIPSCNTSVMLTPVNSATPANQSRPNPSNDNCAQAIELPVTLGLQNDFCNVYSSRGATASSGVPTCGAATPGAADDDVWFRFNVATPGNYGVTVNASGNYNAVIQLFSGNCDSLIAVSCVNNTASGAIETLTASNLVEGVYLVRVYDANAGAGGSGGFVISTYQIIAPPANDNCAQATTLSIGSLHTATSTISATASADVPVCNASNPGTPDDDVWFRFTATSTVTRISVNGGSTYNPVVQLLTGSCGSLTNQTCVSVTGAAGSEVIDFATVIGTNYLVRVYHSANGATPPTGFTILVSNIVPACAALSAPANGTSTIATITTNNLTWTAVNVPSVGTRTYTVQLSTRPTFGTLVSLPNSTNLTATTYTIPANTLAASTLYYWRVVTTNVNGSSTTCDAFRFATSGTVPSCVDNGSPQHQSNNQSVNTTLSWNPGSGTPTGYDVYLSTSESNVINNASAALVSSNQTSTTYLASSLNNSTTYFWKVNARNGSGVSSGCIVSSFTTIAPPPSNDNCASAVVLNASGGAASNGTTLNATQSITGSVGSAEDDVWYSFTAGRNSHTISVVPSSTFNAVVEVFSGTCGSLTSLEVMNDAGTGGRENLLLNDLTVGATYLIRVYEFTSVAVANPTFTIRINDIDLGIASFVSPTQNNCGNTTVTVALRNASDAPIDFSVNPATITGSVLAPNGVTTNFNSVILNTGTLAARTNMNVNLSTSFAVEAAGNYRYTATVDVAEDNNSANNSLIQTLQQITLPMPYILSGTGSYCAGGNGVNFTLNGSQSGVTYQLFRDNNPISTTVNGTGSPINFQNVTVNGNYRVVAINSSTQCRSFMSAQAVVTVNPLWLGINSNWNDAQNWCGNVVPPTNANIIISGSATVMPQLPGNITIGNLELTESNKRIDLNGRTLVVNGSISGDGLIRSSSGSSLVINGTGNAGIIKMDQTTPGVTNRLANLTVNVGSSSSSDSIVLGNALQISGTITLSNGRLSTNGNLTLVSGSSSTARIAAIPSTADITGNVVSQRFVPAVTRRYRMISPNTSLFTYNDIKDDVFVTGSGGATNGFDVASSNSASIFTYQESTSGGRGWKPVTNINQSLLAGRGAIVFIRGDRTLPSPQWFTPPFVSQNEVTIDFVGPVNKGNISPALTFTSTGDASADGWNLVGNPYPSQIDWNLITKSNLNPFVYILNPSTNSYEAHSGTRLIASGQAFFVQANAANPSLTFTESCKAATSPTSYFKTSSLPLTITMTMDSITSDVAWLRFENGANDTFVSSEDALKFSNSTLNMGFRVGTRNTPVQINTVNTLQNIADTFRLFTNASSGNYTLSFEEFSSVPLTKAILLRDLFNNTVTDLRLTNTYTFSINSTAGSAGNRFQLIFIDQSTLPVEFIKVNARAKGDDIVVNWSTATEKNNSKFIIEKSIDGVNFENAGEVKGAGNSSVVRNYTFTDTNAAANASLLNIPVMYYRIRQVDFSGEFSFSNRVSVFFIRNSAQQANNITVFPNPAVDKVTITTANETFGVIGIYNLNGKMVKEQIQLAQETEVFVGDLNAGVYIVKLSDGSTQKLIKQ
jgi:hypothetical protein